MKFHPVEILLMSGVPAPVQEYCRQRVREQRQGAKCWECLRLSERVSCDSFGLKCCRNAFVAMGLEREYAREGRGVRRPERQTEHEDVPRLVADTSRVSAGKPDCIYLVCPVAVWRGIPLNPQELDLQNKHQRSEP